MGGTGGSPNAPLRCPSPSDALLPAVLTVTVLTVHPCAVRCVFSLTVNKRCDCAEASFSSLRWDRAGGRAAGSSHSNWEHRSNSWGLRSSFWQGLWLQETETHTTVQRKD